MAEGFFDIFEKTKAKKPIAEEKSAPAASAMTVSQITKLLESAITTAFPRSVTIRGEVSNVRQQSAGHLYFTLKDAGATLNCVMWKDAAARLKFKLTDGIEMIATGRITVYAPQGRYQLRADSLHPVGQGALELAFRQLQEKLKAEGLFAPDRKKPIPLYPKRIALITSRSTAALQDMLKVLRRFSYLKLMLYHVPVQGEAAGEKIAAAIAHLNRRASDIGGADVILLARGGGSLEDLWAFNEEILARAVADSKIPIITGIGHEIDCSIADLVADYHAHTPTEAAQVVTIHWKKAADSISMDQTRLRRAIRQLAADARQRLLAIQRHEIFRRPMDRIRTLSQMLDDRHRALSMAMTGRMHKIERRVVDVSRRFHDSHPRHRIALFRQKLESHNARLRAAGTTILRNGNAKLDNLHRQLEALSPQAVLKRGYSITMLKKTGQILRTAAEVRIGDKLVTRLSDGQIETEVKDSKQMSLFE